MSHDDWTITPGGLMVPRASSTNVPPEQDEPWMIRVPPDPADEDCLGFGRGLLGEALWPGIDADILRPLPDGPAPACPDCGGPAVGLSSNYRYVCDQLHMWGRREALAALGMSQPPPDSPS
jgi:hypothetical protein